MMSKLKAVAVNYLNTKPLLYGLFNSHVKDEIELRLEIPSECARLLKNGEVDFGLVPVAVIPQLDTPHLFSNYCIGATGTVKTVCLFSECPLEEVENVYLDYHSLTSVHLTKVLLEKYWQFNPKLLPSYPGFESEIKGKTAGLLIGDRSVELGAKYEYCYDLGDAWLQFTGMPFVFAAWVSNKPLPEYFTREFDQALKTGIEKIPDLLYIIPAPKHDFDLGAYFTNHISYEFDAAKRKALKYFLSEIKAPVQPTLEKGLMTA